MTNIIKIKMKNEFIPLNISTASFLLVVMIIEANVFVFTTLVLIYKEHCMISNVIVNKESIRDNTSTIFLLL